MRAIQTDLATDPKRLQVQLSFAAQGTTQRLETTIGAQCKFQARQGKRFSAPAITAWITSKAEGAALALQAHGLGHPAAIELGLQLARLSRRQRLQRKVAPATARALQHATPALQQQQRTNSWIAHQQLHIRLQLLQRTLHRSPGIQLPAQPGAQQRTEPLQGIAAQIKL